MLFSPSKKEYVKRRKEKLKAKGVIDSAFLFFYS